MSSEPESKKKFRWPAWFRPQMIPHAGWELLLMRLTMAYFMWKSVAEVNLNLESQPKPNGFTEWGLDFTFWANDGLRTGLLAGLAIAVVLYTAGWLLLPALGYILLVMITAGGLANSQGSIGHSTQMLTMCLLAEFATLLYLRIRPHEPSLKTSGWISPVPLPHAQWGVHAMKVVIAAGYVSTGLCKVLATKGLWIWQTPYLVVQLRKSNLMGMYDNLQPGNTFITETVPQLIIAHPMLARLVFGSALILELAAFLALLGRGWSLGIGLALIGMHLSISVVMDLNFEYHLVLIAALLVNAPYWLGRPFLKNATA
jgi:hypothetical protein